MSSRRTVIRCRAAAIALWLLACSAQAQVLPTPYASPRTSGKVVDADSGQPIEGVVVLARWEWLNYTPPGFHSSGGYENAGQAVHVGESVTGRDGAYAIPAWGPAIRSGGKMAEGAPDLFAFKTGHEPLHRITQPRDDGLIRLRKSAGDAKVQAQRIGELQRRMHWLESEDWAFEGAMVLALHREKARLGADGGIIFGAHRMPNRSGKGVLLDAATGQPAGSGVAWIEWTLRRLDGQPGARKVVQTKRAGGNFTSNAFFVSPWRLPGPAVAGWEIDPTVKPLVRLYAPGYRRSSDMRWEEAGAEVRVQKLPDTRDALLDELRARRRDIDAQLASGDREMALRLQTAMLLQMHWACRQLAPDLRAGICFDGVADVERVVDAASRVTRIEEEEEDGLRIVTVVSAGSGNAVANAVAASPALAPGSQGMRPNAPRPVGGFSIEPIR